MKPRRLHKKAVNLADYEIPPIRNKTGILNVRVTPEVREALEFIRARDGVPLGEQIRRGVLLWIDTKQIKGAKGTRS